MSNIGKSLHISWEELACKDGTPYPSIYVKDGRIIELVVMFERIRALFGGVPLIINSAYRTTIYNKLVGGSPKSQHLLGKALDIQPPKGVTINSFFIALKLNHKELGIRGLGKYKTFCHCDIRESDNLIEWEG